MRIPTDPRDTLEQQKALRKAVRLEWISLVYMASAVGLVLLVFGSVQAMRARSRSRD